MLLAIAVGLFALATVLPNWHITAVRVTATAQADLTSDQCNAGHTLPVSFVWNGSPTSRHDDAPDCKRSYRAGDQFVAYVDSTDPWNIGPTADWILNPDEHDPFDFLGNSSPRDLAVGIGTWLVIAACGWWLTVAIRRVWRSRRPQVTR